MLKQKKTASSTVILKEVKNISRLNTVEFIFKSVFPFDLINADTDIKNLIQRYKNGDKLNYNEIEMLSVYGISSQAGIDLTRDSYDFAVITVIVKAGYNFDDADADKVVLIDAESNSISIKLPPVEITEIIIKDADSSAYDYPDLNVSPEQWRTLTSILTRKVKTEAEKRGILTAAGNRGKDFIKQLLLGAGYSEVIFHE